MADTEAKKNNKSRLVARYGSRQPDRDWEDEMGFEDLAGFAASISPFVLVLVDMIFPVYR